MNKTKATHPTLANLKAKAEAMGYTVEDDRDNRNLYVHAPDGTGWEDGNLTSLFAPYGFAWADIEKPARDEAIADMLDRLQYYPPSDLAPAKEVSL